MKHGLIFITGCGLFFAAERQCFLRLRRGVVAWKCERKLLLEEGRTAKDFDGDDQMEDDMGIPLGTSDIMKLGRRTAEGDDELEPVKSMARMEHLNTAPEVEVEFDISLRR